MDKINNDNFLFSTGKFAALQEMIRTMEAETRFVTHPCKDTLVTAVKNEPLLAAKYAELAGTSDIENIKDAMDTTQLLIKLGDGDALPVREIGVNSLLDRARISGAALMKVDRLELAKFLNLCLKTSSDDAQVVVVGKKISAVLSENYVPMDMTSIFDMANDSLKRNFKNVSFNYGCIDHRMAMANYVIKDQKLIDTYKSQFPDLCNWDVIPSVTICSSNVGVSGANIFPCFKRGNVEFYIGKPLCVEHKGEASLEKFKANLALLYSVFEKQIKKFAELKKVQIMNPSATFLNIAKRIQLPKKYAMLAHADFVGFLDSPISNAHDIYMGLTEALFKAETDGKDQMFLANMREILDRALFLNWPDYDMPSSEWLPSNPKAA